MVDIRINLGEAIPAWAINKTGSESKAEDIKRESKIWLTAPTPPGSPEYFIAGIELIKPRHYNIWGNPTPPSSPICNHLKKNR